MSPTPRIAGGDKRRRRSRRRCDPGDPPPPAAEAPAPAQPSPSPATRPTRPASVGRSPSGWSGWRSTATRRRPCSTAPGTSPTSSPGPQLRGITRPGRGDPPGPRGLPAPRRRPPKARRDAARPLHPGEGDRPAAPLLRLVHPVPPHPLQPRLRARAAAEGRTRLPTATLSADGGRGGARAAGRSTARSACATGRCSRCLYATAMRRGELVGLDLADVDLAAPLPDAAADEEPLGPGGADGRAGGRLACPPTWTAPARSS